MNSKHSCPAPGRQDYEQALESMGTYIDVNIADLMTLAERAAEFARRRVSEALLVSRIMTTPVQTVHPQTLLTEAAHLMVSLRISGLPVVNHDDQLVGLITEADFLRSLGVPAHVAGQTVWHTLEALFSQLSRQNRPEAPEDSVSEYMVKDIITLSPQQDVHEAVAMMKRHSIKRLLVCDEQRHVVGMVTRSDLVRLFFDRYTVQPSA